MRYLNLPNLVLATASAGLWALAYSGYRAVFPGVVACSYEAPAACQDTSRWAHSPYRRNAGVATGWRLRGEQDGVGLIAATSCHNGTPHVDTPDTTLTGFALDENMLHELMHQQQFHSNCDSIMALWNAEPFYRLALEAQATCYGLEAWPELMRGLRRGVDAKHISAAYGAAFEDVYAALDSACATPPETPGLPTVWLNLGRDSLGTTVSTQPKQVVEPGIAPKSPNP